MVQSQQWLSRIAWGSLTIACNNNELVILVDIMYLNIWEGGDYLLLRRKVCALLELEVTYRTRQGKVAIYTAKVNKATSSLDTRFLSCGLSVMPGYKWEALPSFWGLWSNESGFARPLTPRTVRESPELACFCEPLSEMLCRITYAVDLIFGHNCHSGSAARDLFFILGIYFHESALRISDRVQHQAYR
jgi:hypothetical protein